MLADGINLRQLWHIVLERRWVVTSVFASVFLISLIYLFKASPIFKATTRLEIERPTGGLLDLSGQTLTIEAHDGDYLQTQYRNLLSRTLVRKVMTRLDLDKDPRYSNEVDPLRGVIEDIDVSPIRLSRLIDVDVHHPDPNRAAEIANTLVEMFLADNLDQKKAKSWDSFLFLQNEVETLEREVQRASLDVHRFRQKHNLVSLEEDQNITAQALRQAQQDYDEAHKEATNLSRIAQKVEESLASGINVETIPHVADNLVINTLKSSLLTHQADLERLLERYRDSYPAVIEARKQIQAEQNQIKSEASKIIASLHQRADIAAYQEAAALQHLRTVEDALHELSEKQVEYDVLERKSARSKYLYEVVLGKAKEMDLISKESMQNMRIVDRATPPLRRHKPNVAITLLAGLFGGLVIGVGFAFFAHFVDDTIKSQEDVELGLGVDFLGFVPNIRTNNLSERMLQSHLHPQSNSSESFRTVRAAISLSHRDVNLNCLTITSTMPSEGKSLFAANLAIVNAQTGLRTLIVDSDLRRPSAHRAFQTPNEAGLTQFLKNESDSIDELIHSTTIPNLDILPAGKLPSNPSELVGSARMKTLISLLKGKYDRLIIDCPPVSAVSDPLVISALAEGTIFLTKFNRIRKEHARRSVQRLKEANIKILGAVINDIDFEGRDAFYYSYYYYQNRYYAAYYGQTQPGKELKRLPSPTEVKPL